MLEVYLAGYTIDIGHAHQLLHARAWYQSLMHPRMDRQTNVCSGIPL